jgi:GxxExxY protein
MTENEIATVVVDAVYHIHVELGPGLLESVYEEVLDFELRKSGLTVERQKSIPILWNGHKMEHGFRADLIVENKVLIEIKSIETLLPTHFKQVVTYLKLGNLKLGLLINFNEALIKNGIKRIVNNL